MSLPSVPTGLVTVNQADNTYSIDIGTPTAELAEHFEQIKNSYTQMVSANSHQDSSFPPNEAILILGEKFESGGVELAMVNQEQIPRLVNACSLSPLIFQSEPAHKAYEQAMKSFAPITVFDDHNSVTQYPIDRTECGYAGFGKLTALAYHLCPTYCLENLPTDINSLAIIGSTISGHDMLLCGDRSLSSTNILNLLEKHAIQHIPQIRVIAPHSASYSKLKSDSPSEIADAGKTYQFTTFKGIPLLSRNAFRVPEFIHHLLWGTPLAKAIHLECQKRGWNTQVVGYHGCIGASQETLYGLTTSQRFISVENDATKLWVDSKSVAVRYS
ncbi:MAG: hypothetical protein ACPGUD_06725 [Parashewanella sp.]